MNFCPFSLFTEAVSGLFTGLLLAASVVTIVAVVIARVRIEFRAGLNKLILDAEVGFRFGTDDACALASQCESSTLLVPRVHIFCRFAHHA